MTAFLEENLIKKHQVFKSRFKGLKESLRLTKLLHTTQQAIILDIIPSIMVLSLNIITNNKFTAKLYR